MVGDRVPSGDRGGYEPNWQEMVRCSPRVRAFTWLQIARIFIVQTERHTMIDQLLGKRTNGTTEVVTTGRGGKVEAKGGPRQRK